MLAETLRALPVQETGWITLDRARVQGFADVTEDWQFIHLDEARAAQTPFGGTIAHGFLTLSMLSAMSYQIMDGVPGIASSVNYGFDRIRFVAPVRVGHRIKGRFTLASLEEQAGGALDAHWEVQVLIEEGARPALVAHWITRFYPEVS